MTIVVRRIRRIRNPRLEALYWKKDANAKKAQVNMIRGMFHGTESRLCEIIAEEGFQLPKELGNKTGRFGNAVCLTNQPAVAHEHKSSLGRVRSLLVCDVFPGRVLNANESVVEGTGDEVPDLPGMDLARLQESGFDSVFASSVDGRHLEYAIYDPGRILPCYLVDVDLVGLGESEVAAEESLETKELWAELERLRTAEEGNARLKDLRSTYKKLAAAVQTGSGSNGLRLRAVQRHHDAGLWDRCANRLAQANQVPCSGSGMSRQILRLLFMVHVCVFESCAGSTDW
ncbi:unnamed protein product [Polarella glacialis]|uniref:PARP catalytic domain-containing protein n=1 Tax=Polarella glacialis TaxID=89957 RepID=A0A813DCP9_POLGL|nr:unnamed protein product [Polarella glacialis]